MRAAAALIALGALLLCAASVQAQQSKLRKQLKHGGPIVALTQAELAALNDPLFRLVLKGHAGEVELDKVEALIRGASGALTIFVVDERIIASARGTGRRGVGGFTGTNGGAVLGPNVMLSFAFDAQQVQPAAIEGWGWDDKNSRYNYYRLDQQSDENRPTWKFRGSSIGADKLTPDERRGTCFACHVNGGPLMKELLFPWNNWHGPRSPAPYLNAATPGHWPIAETDRFKTLKGAETLEQSFLLPSLRQFNGRRIDALIKKTASGGEISDGRRVLRPLFVTTEYNAISSDDLSGLHPFAASASGPPGPIGVPDAFFLNANLLAGGGFTGYAGLGISEARAFASLLDVKPDEYKKLVSDAKTKLDGKLGDASFAWFVPEASHIDNHAVDALLRRGVITAQFAAAVLAVDLENPVFSPARARLLDFVPASFKFKPRNADDVPASHPDELTKAVIQALKTAQPAAGTPESELLTRLEAQDPVELLRQSVLAYLARVRAELNQPAKRPAELKRLFSILIARRRAALDDPVLRALNETENALFPVPD